MKPVSHIILGTLLASGAALASSIDFDKHDKDGDGFLSQDEWREIDQAVVDFERADANRDGRLDRDETRNATEQSMEISATQQTGSDDEMQATVYSQSGQQIEAERSGGETSSEERVDVELASDEHIEADGEDSTNTGVESTAGQQGDIQRTTADEAVDEREPVRTESVAQSETERKSSQAANEQDMAADSSEDDTLVQQTSVQTENQSGEEFREMDQEREVGDPLADNPPRSEVAPVRAGFDASGEGMQVFEETDTDGDARISESEARLAGHDYVAIYFDQMDVDGDGYLHHEEWDLTRREGMDAQNVSTEDRVQSMQGDDGEDLQYEDVSHERVGEDEEPAEEDETDFER